MWRLYGKGKSDGESDDASNDDNDGDGKDGNGEILVFQQTKILQNMKTIVWGFFVREQTKNPQTMKTIVKGFSVGKETKSLVCSITKLIYFLTFIQYLCHSLK